MIEVLRLRVRPRQRVCRCAIWRAYVLWLKVLRVEAVAETGADVDRNELLPAEAGQQSVEKGAVWLSSEEESAQNVIEGGAQDALVDLH